MKWNDFNRHLHESARFDVPDIKERIDVNHYITTSLPVRMNWMKVLGYGFSAIILVMTFSFYLYLSHSTFTTLTIDINPSIVAEVNGFGRIISTSASNTDGEDFLAKIDSNRMKLEDFIDAVYVQGLEENYFTEDSAYMLIGIYSNSYQEEVNVAATLNATSQITPLYILSHMSVGTTVMSSTIATSGTLNDSTYSSFSSSVFTWFSTNQEAVTTTMNFTNPESTISSDAGSVDTPETPADFVTFSITIADLESLSEEYGISYAKLTLASYIFNTNEDYTTQDDFVMLINMDIESLIVMYQDMID